MDQRGDRSREKLKKWKREWKVALINELNPGWKDLLSEFEI